MSEVYFDSMKNLEDMYYLFTPLIEVAHTSMYDVQLEVHFNCKDKLP